VFGVLAHNLNCLGQVVLIDRFLGIVSLIRIFACLNLIAFVSTSRHKLNYIAQVFRYVHGRFQNSWTDIRVVDPIQIMG